MPAYDGLERQGTDVGTPLVGWQAMVDSIVILSAKFWIVIFEPRFFVLFFAPIGNGIVLLAPFFAQIQREESGLLALPLVAIAAMMWFLPAQIYEHTLLGFWVWNWSTLTIGIAIAINAIAMRQLDNAR